MKLLMRADTHYSIQCGTQYERPKCTFSQVGKSIQLCVIHDDANKTEPVRSLLRI